MNSDFFEEQDGAEGASQEGGATASREAAPEEVAPEREEAEEAEATEGDGGPKLSEELEALRDRYLRLAAEYDNYRKRTERERIEGRDRAQAQLVETLLEPLDDLQRVAGFKAESTTLESLLEGVRMVERKLVRALEAAGLESLEAQGERFDPELHEALMMTPTEKAEEDETVGEVFQNGYRFRGNLLRPARVQVRQHGE
ncbi:MAG: nucleotide exchange factor GrpE [Gemmatimonas sp.]|nr:nucleotide exchange factor GrpE [Gemmatimonas sp.]